MKEILTNIVEDILKKIKSNKGLSEFVKNRAKFEGWLKVEIIDSALKNGCLEVVPEKTLIDVTFLYEQENYALELKTINTNYFHKGVLKKTRPITKNIESVIKDINDLKLKDYSKRFVLFIVFPLDLKQNSLLWKRHIDKLNSLAKLDEFSFEFYNGEKGILYLGQVL